MEDQEIKDWVVDLNKEFDDKINVEYSREAQEEQWDKFSIYKLPASFMTGSHNKAYIPQVVSFGPYHHGDERLKKMEFHKHRVLRHFLCRSSKTLQNLVDGLKEDKELVQQLLNSYDSLDEKWWRDQDGFLKLMILDGCFILEILLWVDRAKSDEYIDYYSYAKNDPIFSHHGSLNCMTHIRKDMLLLENQLPMLLLKTLLAVESPKPSKEEIDLEMYLNTIISSFCITNSTEKPKIGTCLHILDVYRKNLLINFQIPTQRQCSGEKMTSNEGKKLNPNTSTTTSSIRRNMSRSSRGNGWRIVQTAVNLREAGIKFEKSESRNLKDISFQGGVLTLPYFFIDDTTESTFLNLMAFERFHVRAENEITSYVCFMDSIIDSAKDVQILRRSKIIDSAMGSDKAVANLFNEIAKNVTPEAGESLDQVQVDLNAYCETEWHEWRANLIHTYFRNPWAFISLFAAIMLLALTLAQTFFAIYSPYKSQEVVEVPRGQRKSVGSTWG